MKRSFVIALMMPLLAASKNPDEQAVIAVLSTISAGEALPEEVLDRQVGYDFPDLDQSLARAKGCSMGVLDPLQNGNFAVQWRCKNRKSREMPSPLILNVRDGMVVKITTAELM